MRPRGWRSWVPHWLQGRPKVQVVDGKSCTLMRFNHVGLLLRGHGWIGLAPKDVSRHNYTLKYTSTVDSDQHLHVDRGRIYVRKEPLGKRSTEAKLIYGITLLGPEGSIYIGFSRIVPMNHQPVGWRIRQSRPHLIQRILPWVNLDNNMPLYFDGKRLKVAA